ncbi:hypothetical protein Bca52824_026129 [Brassica carinata]|uniref:Uncharacterized protein n=1 Tax=Brassica carinata TaxID=52824 RepID=A0A8X7VA66_BRACI|nr:hypothetical protein Bca52824_026129 [Brassica carinata]
MRFRGLETSTCTCEAVETLVPPATFSFSSANPAGASRHYCNQGGVCSEESGEAEMRSSAVRRQSLNSASMEFFVLVLEGEEKEEDRFGSETREEMEIQGDGEARRRRLREEEELLRREDATAKSDVGSVEECSKLEFTKDEVFALLSES